jgi:hypothetical protein
MPETPFHLPIEDRLRTRKELGAARLAAGLSFRELSKLLGYGHLHGCQGNPANRASNFEYGNYSMSDAEIAGRLDACFRVVHEKAKIADQALWVETSGA